MVDLLIFHRAYLALSLQSCLQRQRSNISSFLHTLGDEEHRLWMRHPQWRVTFLRRLRLICPPDAEYLVEFWKPILEDFVL